MRSRSARLTSTMQSGRGASNYGTPGTPGDDTTRRQFVAVGVHESGNGVALVSPMVDISIEN